jgi:transglutaminase-like putative cysteine protease/sugar lactone lactonase YvrE
MCRKGLLLTALLALSLCLNLFAHSGKVIRSFPSPGGYPTGMTFDGSHIWVADYKADKLFRIDSDTGRTVSMIDSPGFWPMGLAWDGTSLWNVDAKQEKIFQVDPENGAILKVIDAPSGNPAGLVWDGETLWISDFKAKKIMKIDLSDGTAVKTVTAPARSADGLAFDGTYLWCSDRTMDELYMIEPDSGEVVLISDAPGPYPRGMAWDGKSIWNVDYQNDRIYELVRQDGQTFQLKNARKALITLTHEVKVYGQGMLKDLDVYIAVPDDMPQQKVLSTRFSPGNPAFVKDRWHQSVAAFHHENMPAETTIQSIMEVEAEISEIRYFIFPDQCGTLDDIPQDLRDLYTSNGSKFCTDDPYIRDLAKKIVGDEKHPYYMARKIFDHVRNSLEYKLEGGWNVAPVVLKRGTGSCSEYTFCFIALCRAAGLPARYVGAIVVRGDDASLDDVFHRWPEVYLPGYGWIPMDPQGGDKPTPRDRAMNIGNLSNRFLITTQGGGDSKYLGWYYNYNEAFKTDPKVRVNIEAFGEWEPMGKEESRDG